MKNLKSCRKNLHITLVKLGGILGVSYQTLAAYENDTRTPPADMLIKLADYFDTTIDYLLGRTGEKENAPPPQLSEDEARVLTAFRQCDDYHKALIIGYAEATTERPQSKKTLA